MAYQLKGTVTLVLGDRETSVHPGEFAFIDGSTSLTLTADDRCRSVVMRLRPDAVPLLHELLHGATVAGIRPNTGIRAATEVLYAGLAATANRLHGWTGERLAQSAIDLACVTLAEYPRGISESVPFSWEFAKACEFAEENLGDADLDTRRIATATYMSTRQLQKVFQAEGTTVTRWIRDRRLKECRAMLVNPEYRWMSVGEVGARWGFFNQPHFSRTYREAFGVSPRDDRSGR